MSKISSTLPGIIFCALAAFLTATPANALAAIRYVNAARPDDSGDGLSWAAAKKTLQAALASAFGGDEIWVAAGVYKPDQGGGQSPGNRSAAFQPQGAVYGGFAGGETSLSQRDVAINLTVLSGDLSGNDISVPCASDSGCASFGENCLDGVCNIADNNDENSFHVVRVTGPDVILDGFIVTAGNANGSTPNNQGGGMWANGGMPRVANCLFTRNFANFGGGGMYDSSNSAKVTACTFLGNSCGPGGGSGGGGGMLSTSGNNVTVTKCVFRENVAPGGGGGGTGGGLRINNGSPSTVLNCAFFGNRATMGGGMAITNFGGGPIANLAFSGNAADLGGALYMASGSPAPANCTFSRNIASNQGGGIYVAGGSPTIRNSILWENSDAGGMDEAAQIRNAGGSPVVNYSIVQGGWTGASGPGNLASNPLLTDADGPDNIYGTPDDDLGVMAGSPTIDSANSGHLNSDFADLDDDGDTGEAIPIDLAGNARQVDDPLVADTGQGPAPIVDMGAHERQVASKVYVDAGATGADNGSSWADAFLHLQSALSFASMAPSITEIWVADGTYMPDGGRIPAGMAHIPGSGARAATFQLLSNLSIYGGFAGGETMRSQRDIAANPTTLSGDLLGDDTPVPCTQNSPDCDSFGGLCVGGFCIIAGNNVENSYHVVNGSGTNAAGILDGFTIAAGNASGPPPEDRGAALFNDVGSPTVANCTLRGNSAAGHGGGTFSFNGGPSFLNCVFRGNSAGSNAGAMFNLGSSPTVANCVFHRNTAQGSAGAMENDFNSSPKVVNCEFTRNSANANGGGMFNVSGSSPVLTNCLFNGNSADFGGAMATSSSATAPLIINCTFSSNSASFSGGGVYSSSGASPSIRNSILWGNADSGGMDESAQIHADGGNVAVFFSIIQGGWGGPGLQNSGADPQFLDFDGVDNVLGTIDDNVRLRKGSPAINTGNNVFVPADAGDLDGDGDTAEQTPLDLAGEPRFAESVDRGAYEYFTDCNNNGVPDSTDIAQGTSQDCDGGGKFWQQNGVPDECDMASCPTPESCVGGADHGEFCTFDGDCDSGDCAGEEFYGCQDCNLNGVLDACDINGQTSLDSDFDCIPDECRFFTGNCALVGQERFWSCPENWLLAGQYPDDEDSAAGISVTLPSSSVVVLDQTVVIPNLHIASGAELQMITHDTILDVDQAIQVDGTLTMESCRLVGNTPPTLTIGAGGRFQTASCTSAGPPSTMTAAEIRILGTDCSTPPCPDGGRVELDESISLVATGDLVIDGSMADGACQDDPPREGDGDRLGLRRPPSYRAAASSTTIVEGAMYVIGAAQVIIDTIVPVELGGDFVNQSVRPDCFHWESGSMTLVGSGQTFEVAATDIGPAAVGRQGGGASHGDFAMGAVIIAGGASVTFQDAFDNNLLGQDGCTEALYVGALTLEPGASMTIRNCRVYYGTFSGDAGGVTFEGCAEMVPVPILPDAPEPDPDAIDQNRFLSLMVPPAAGRGPGQLTALRVTLSILNRPRNCCTDASGALCSTTTCAEDSHCSTAPDGHQTCAHRAAAGVPDYSAMQDNVRYVNSFAFPAVGGSLDCPDDGPPFNTSYKCATLGCEPEYRDWATDLAAPGPGQPQAPGLIYITGDAVVPSSTFGVSHIAASCGAAATANACASASALLPVGTARWADITGPGFSPPDGKSDVLDIPAVVNKLKSVPTFFPEPRTWLKQRDPAANSDAITVVDLSDVVDGVLSKPYPASRTLDVCPHD